MSQRRGQCPTLAMPMATGDGLLARMNPVSGGISPETLAAIGRGAAQFGNGLLEITARSSLQIRGLTTETAPRLAATVEALDISVRSGVPVETGPLAGLDPEEVRDPRELADEIRDGVVKAGLSQRLGPKVSVIVDGGGRLKLGALLADVRLEAVAANGGALWRVAVGGTAETARIAGLVSGDEAVVTVIAILEAVAAKGRMERAKDLSLETLSSVLPPSVLPDISSTRGEIGCGKARHPSRNGPDWRNAGVRPISPLVEEMSGRTEGGNMGQSPVSLFPLSDGRFALGLGLPFGQSTAAQIIGFADAAEHCGVDELRFAPGRALLAMAPTREVAEGLKKTANALGFVTDAADPRLSIVACAGAPACASGHLASRELAAEIAADATGGALAHGEVLHISGCAKQCAKPARPAFTLVGTADGAELYAGDGVAGDPIARVANDAAADAFRHAVRLDRQENNKRDKPAARSAQAG